MRHSGRYFNQRKVYTDKMIETIVIAIIGSGALSTLISSVFTAFANRKSRLKKIEGKLDDIEKNQKTAEKDSMRSQLLMMIADYPEENTEILKLAEHYFSDLHGNWTATAIFNKWLERCEVAKPEWFKYK